MNDRVSNYPNRWKLTPVTGQTNVYDMERADDPTVAGTPLNKATFLPDAVASAVEAATGASGVSLPADALNALASALDGIGLNGNTKIDTYSYVGTGSSSSRTTTFAIHPRIVFYLQDGKRIGGSQLNGSTKGCDYQIWMYNSDAGYLVEFTYNESNKQLTRVSTASTTADRPIFNMNQSGVTYYVVAIGVK